MESTQQKGSPMNYPGVHVGDAAGQALCCRKECDGGLRLRGDDDDEGRRIDDGFGPAVCSRWFSGSAHMVGTGRSKTSSTNLLRHPEPLAALNNHPTTQPQQQQANNSSNFNLVSENSERKQRSTEAKQWAPTFPSVKTQRVKKKR
jgi:hypothetical protein